MSGSEWLWTAIPLGGSGDSVFRVVDPSGVGRYLKISSHGTGLLTAERDRMIWLRGRVPVPEVLGFVSREGTDFLLTSEVPGLPACDTGLAREMDPRAIVSGLARGLRRIHDIGTAGSPFVDLLESKIARATADARARGDEAIDEFLARPRPAEDLVFAHGDYCEPNILFHQGRISGFIDLGHAGVMDRYCDFGQVYYSLNRNGHGDLLDFFFAEYGLPDRDREKVQYYRSLEDLFGT
jgi:aminoglycoside phosphotransferase